MLLRYALLAAALIAAPGCELFFGEGDEPPLSDGIDRCDPREPVTIDSGTIYQYVIDTVDLPTTGQEAQDYGVNLDRDPERQPDNALGYIISTIGSALGSDFNAKVDELIGDGTILHLVEVRTDDLANAAVSGARVFLGTDTDGDPSDNFSGAENFEIEPGHPTRPMTGTIINGHIDVSLGVIPLRIAMPGVDEVFDFEVTGARLVADVTADGLDGVLAGGLSEQEVHDGLLPFLTRAFQNSVALDCPDGVCVDGSQGEAYLALFDQDGDGEITAEEVEESNLISSLFAPDTDLFDEDRRFNPQCDGVKESLSLGVRVHAVPASFDAPAW